MYRKVLAGLFLAFVSVFTLSAQSDEWYWNQPISKIDFNGLKNVKDHSKLDKKWYSETIVSNMRAILSDYPIVKTKEQLFRKLSECVFVKENKEVKEKALYELISEVYPERVVANNREWAHALWKDDSDVLNVWGLDEFCEDIQSKEKLSGIVLDGRGLRGPPL